MKANPFASAFAAAFGTSGNLSIVRREPRKVRDNADYGPPKLGTSIVIHGKTYWYVSPHRDIGRTLVYRAKGNVPGSRRRFNQRGTQ